MNDFSDEFSVHNDLLNFMGVSAGQGSSLIICVGILTGYTDTLSKMLTQLSGGQQIAECETSSGHMIL